MNMAQAIQLWCGSEASFTAFETAVKSAQSMVKAHIAAGSKEQDSWEIELPPLYTRMGDVGVIDIKGSLINGSAGIWRLFGVTGYDDIQGALFEGLKDKKAKRLMLNVESPGGSVKGLKDIAETLKASRDVKPLNAFAQTANSAAYWLASAASHITLDEMGEAGSIGCIAVHTEYSKLYEKEGIKKTAIRAGENKALASPFEPLSEKALEQMQAHVNKARDMFVAAVADNRGVTSATVQSQFGDGKTFMGSDALGPGLVDKIGSFQDALRHGA